jgi:sulfur carrier protein ThiS
MHYNALRHIAQGGAMSRSTTSIRLEDELRDHLTAAAAAEGTTMTDLIERFVREGLAVAAHPGIVFKPGPSGRRAALAGGPDVWEVVAALRHVPGSEAKRVKELAKQFGIHERQVVIALNYAAANREEIDARISANDLALDEAERVAGERERLLA